MLVEYAYLFLRLIFNTVQLRFYHCPLQLYHCTNGQCYHPILGPVFMTKPLTYCTSGGDDLRSTLASPPPPYSPSLAWPHPVPGVATRDYNPTKLLSQAHPIIRYSPQGRSHAGFTKFTQLHVVTSQFVMFISCALRARIKDGTGSRLDSCEVNLDFIQLALVLRVVVLYLQ